MDKEALAHCRAEYNELIASVPFAYAMGHGCTIGSHEQFTRSRTRANDLKAILDEHGG